MLKIENPTLLHQVIADAISNVHFCAQSRERRNRWINALARATYELQNRPQFLKWEEVEKSLQIWSESNEFYFVSSGKCQCDAFATKQPCWHRAVYKIVSLYFEKMTEANRSVTIHPDEHAIYCKPQIASEKLRGVRI